MQNVQLFLNSLAEITSLRQYSATNHFNIYRVADADGCLKRSLNKIYRFNNLDDISLSIVANWKEDLFREDYKPDSEYYWIDVKPEEIEVNPSIGVRQHFFGLLEEEIGQPSEVYRVNLEKHEGYLACSYTELLFITKSGHYILSFQAHD